MCRLLQSCTLSITQMTGKVFLYMFICTLSQGFWLLIPDLHILIQHSAHQRVTREPLTRSTGLDGTSGCVCWWDDEFTGQESWSHLPASWWRPASAAGKTPPWAGAEPACWWPWVWSAPPGWWQRSSAAPGSERSWAPAGFAGPCVVKRESSGWCSIKRHPFNDKEISWFTHWALTELMIWVLRLLMYSPIFSTSDASCPKLPAN